MDSVLRALALYVCLLVLFRFAGKRTVTEMSNFEFVLLLIVGEATQQAILGKDYSITNALLVITTLILLNITLSSLKHRSRTLRHLVDGLPVIIVEDGHPVREHMDRAHVADDEVMAAARELQGLERMDQIKYAVLESTGGISIIPKE